MKPAPPATDSARVVGKSVAIVSARFYADLADWLEDGARRGLAACGVTTEQSMLVRVPGCFELPLAARRVERAA